MLYDKRQPSLKDKIIQDEEERTEQELKNKNKRGISRASVKKTRKKIKKK